MMKLEYDKDVDAAYLYLKTPIRKGEVKKTKGMSKTIFLDYDKGGRIIGVEILNASKVLPLKELKCTVKD